MTAKPAGTGPQAGWADVNKRRAGGRRVGAAQRPPLSSPLPELFMFQAVAMTRLWDIICQALFTDLNLHNRSEEEKLTFLRLPQHSLHPDRSAPMPSWQPSSNGSPWYCHTLPARTSSAADRPGSVQTCKEMEIIY